MKKIFESDWNTLDNGESAERVFVYQLENDDEYWDFLNSVHEERCALFKVFDERGTHIEHGCKYYAYEFDYTDMHVVMYEIMRWNI